MKEDLIPKIEYGEECPYYPCHVGVNIDEFTCKFCWCPLYTLPDCGGNFELMLFGDYNVGYKVIKDCSGCTKVHDSNAEKFVGERINQVLQLDSKLFDLKKLTEK